MTNRFRVTEDEHHVSIFCPPLRGDERHDRDGAYEANGTGPKTDRRMFVKRADEMRAAGKEMVVANGQARTIRMLTQADDIGFGLSDVHVDAGAETVLWYKHHWEANHILTGIGEVTDLTSGQSWKAATGHGLQRRAARSAQVACENGPTSAQCILASLERRRTMKRAPFHQAVRSRRDSASAY